LIFIAVVSGGLAFIFINGEVNPVIEEDIFKVDLEKYPNKFYKVTDNSNGDIFMDPLGGAKPESTIIFYHDQYKNNKDVYKMFSQELAVQDGNTATPKTLAPLNSRIVIP